MASNAIEVRHNLFFSELAIDGNVTRASRCANLDYKSLYRQRKMDAEFADRWTAALDSYADTLEAEAFRRAVQGVSKPISYQGQFTYEMERDAKGRVIYDEVDEGQQDKDGKPILSKVPRYKLDEHGRPTVVAIKEYSDSILLAMLKAKKPQEYRDNSRVELGNVPGETFKTDETPLQAARKIAFALALGLQNAEKMKENGEDLA